MFGETPMRDALHRTLAVFQNDTSSSTSQRTLLLASDGNSTDGDPQPIADELKREQVTIATVYLTGDREIQTHDLYYEPNNDWNEGQRNLFNMASRISCYTHPIPVLASMGWSVPSSGECALYVQVCSAAVLNQFCEFLLSARFGSADALLDVVGRVHLDKYIQRKNRRTCRKPSNQGEEGSCYAHAIAGVIHMALRRIHGREEGYPSIKDIRRKILLNFPWEPHGQPAKEVLEEAVAWYPPLLFKETDEQGARQAVLRRRPVLATFRLSSSGWDAFSQHFQTSATSRSVLTQDLMAPHRSLPDDGGHAVIMTRCPSLLVSLTHGAKIGATMGALALKIAVYWNWMTRRGVLNSASTMCTVWRRI